jgi:squalene-associated FAD-dependent desaturase
MSPPEAPNTAPQQAAATKHYDVAIIGAGVAGLAAAVALAADGASVALLERRPFVGGRAYSYPHPSLNETIDSQHVILGCCTNFIDLLTQSKAAHTIRWYDELTFLEPHATRTPTASHLKPSRLFPAPLHQSLSFLRSPMLSLRDKLGIAYGLTHFLRSYPQHDNESFATWLRRTHQTDRAIRHFWEPVIVGALNDTFANCSTRYAGKVFHESFLRSPAAGRLGIPTAPLSDFFAPVAAHAIALGVDLHLNTPADTLTPLPNHRWRITSASTASAALHIEANAVILATDLRQTHRLQSELSGGSSGLQPAVNPPSHEGALAPVPAPDPTQFTTAPITTIHLWYDREITPLDHAVLLDTRIQWVFNKSRIRRWPASQGTYLELVISASQAELTLSREQILADALTELALFFPQIHQAKLLKSAVLKEARATFSVTPNLDAHRPPQTTPHPNLYLAGDYTATGWPSTMESAIRSGRLAAALAANHPRTHFLAPELPATGLMRLLTRRRSVPHP